MLKLNRLTKIMKKLVTVVLWIIAIGAYAQYPIGNTDITFNDPDRNNRAIACEIYYPGTSSGANVDVATGTFPIIVFGHGFSMQVGAYPNWREEFVPDGYIMVFPTTEGSPFTPDHEAFGLDLRFLVTQMQAENSNGGSLFNQHVAPRSAIMGHSMGGGSTILGAANFANVDCIVGLAPAETNPSAVTAAPNVSAPAMILSGTSDGVTPPDDHHIPIYNALGSNCKYFVPIVEGSHCYFASNTVTCTFGEFNPGSLPAEDQRQSSYAVCRPWFDYFLKDDCEAWDDFESALANDPNLGTITSDCIITAPVITENGGVLESDNQPNYQWYYEGNPIPNETNQTHAYGPPGMYQVASILLGNCPTFSNEMDLQTVGLQEDEIRLHSFSSGLQIFSDSDLNNVTLSWYDAAGRLLDSQGVSLISGNGRIHIDKPEIIGPKLLLLQSDEAVRTWKFY